MARVAVLAVFAATLALVSANPVRLNLEVEPESQVVREGQETILSFSLSEPILCSDFDSAIDNCRVLLLLTNTRPDEIQLSQCYVEWTEREWQTTKTITVTGVEDFVNDGNKEFVLITEPLSSHAPFYNGFNPKDINIKTETHQPAQCTSWTDPNYNTFDGKRYTWNRGGTKLLWATDHRQWEVQTRLSSGRNCGVAVKDGCDLIVLDQCSSRGLVVYSDFHNPASSRLQLLNKKNSNVYYIKSTRSAAEVKVTAQHRINIARTRRCGWSGCSVITRTSRTDWLDVVGTAPGDDFGYIDNVGGSNNVHRTRGLCGSYDGNRNNDDTNGNNFEVSSSHDFFRSRKLQSCSIPPPKELDPERCDYVPKVVQRPILRHPDVEDLTELIKHYKVKEDDPRATYHFDPTDEEAAPELTTEQEEFVRTLCERAITESVAADVCREVGVELERFITGCVVDVGLQQDQELIDGSVEAMKEECEFLASTNIDLFDGRDEDGNLRPGELQQRMVSNICPNDCSFNGQCVNGTCICDQEWTGPDCFTLLDHVPEAHSLAPAACDSLLDCSNEIIVETETILGTDNLACKIGENITVGRFASTTQVACPTPDLSHSGAKDLVLPVSISKNGEVFSNAIDFVFYDSTCRQCSQDGECSTADNACEVDDLCYVAGQAHEDNPCRRCQPNKAQDSLSDYFEDEQCVPQFDSSAYYRAIPEDQEQGSILLTVSVDNDLLEDEEYTLELSSDADGIIELDTELHSAVGAVRSLGSFDFETKSRYEFEVIATGKNSGIVRKAPLVIEVQDINERPTFSGDNYVISIDENETKDRIIKVEATDPDTSADPSLGFGTIKYSIDAVSPSWASEHFVINAHTGELSVASPLDHERRENIEVTVAARDGGGESATKPVAVTVNDVDEAPTNILLSGSVAYEGADAGTVVGTLVTIDDDDNESFTYDVSGGDGNFGVEIVDGKPSLVTAKVIETGGKTQSFEIDITSTDKAGLSVTVNFQVLVFNKNDAPTDIFLFESGPNDAHGEHDGDMEVTTQVAYGELESIAEDVFANTIVGRFVVDDADETDVHTFTLVNDGDGHFAVSGPFLILVKPLDYETQTSHTITVYASDNGGLNTQPVSFTIEVENRPDPPQDVHLTVTVDIQEDTSVGTVIGVVSGFDQDQDQNMELSVDDNCPYRLGDVTCETIPTGTQCTAQAILRTALDFEGEDEPRCTVTATSEADGRFSTQQTYFNVKDVNEAPTDIKLSQSEVSEGAALNSVVGILTAADPDGQAQRFTFEVLDGANKPFKVVKDTATQESRLVVSKPLDHETQPTVDVIVRVRDSGGLTFSKTLTITVTDKPWKLMLSNSELPEFVSGNAPEKHVEVGVISIDGFDSSNVVPQFAIVGEGTKLFELGVSGSEATLYLRSTEDIDYDSGVTSLSVTIRASFRAKRDGSGNNPKDIEQTFAITIVPQDDPPVFVAFPEDTVAISPDADAGAFVANTRAVDPDSDSTTITYSISSGNELDVFGINRETGQIRVARTPSSAGLEGTVQLVITASDGTKTTSQTLTVELSDEVGNSPDNNKSKASVSGGMIGGIVAVCVLIVVLVVAVLVVVMRKRREDEDAGSSKELVQTFQPESMDNPVYHANPALVGAGGSSSNAREPEFVPGVANPFYSWYKPDASREEVVYDLLDSSSTVGTFAVRDYKPTPGWHMLHVKVTPDQVRDEKIRHVNAKYQLVVTGSSFAPQFDTVPSLVQHYASPAQRDLPVTLDATLAGGAVASDAEARGLADDANAPAVPLKRSQRDLVAQIAAVDDMYDNTAMARDALKNDSSV